VSNQRRRDTLSAMTGVHHDDADASRRRDQARTHDLIGIGRYDVTIGYQAESSVVRNWPSSPKRSFPEPP
jgi:hypothetical protein